MIYELYKKFRLYGWRQFLRFAFIETRRKGKQFTRHSYSQSGEDLLLDKLTGNQAHGFYVDVGAYDPHRLSNTKRFYKRGWRGINVEPNTKRYEKFMRERTRDINVNLGITDVSGTAPQKAMFYEFFPDTLSTFSEHAAQEYRKKGHPLVRSMEVSVDTLAHILEQYAKNTPIDFLSTDTEGFDLTVLKSNDWNRFRPRVICVESSDHADLIMNKDAPRTVREEDLFLDSVGYTKQYDNGLNSIYVRRDNNRNAQ